MTISATTQGLRPGVCTSTSRPSTPFTGQLIYETDTNRLAVWNGTSWVFLADADTPSGMQLITSASFTTSSGETYSCFSSEFDNYHILLTITATSATGVDILFQLGNSGTFANSNYGNFIYYILSDGTSGVWGVNNFSTSGGFIGYAGGDKPPIVSDICLFSPFVSSETRYTLNSFTSYVSSGNQRRASLNGAGGHGTSSSYSQMRIYPVSGTMTGSVKIYGYRNS